MDLKLKDEVTKLLIEQPGLSIGDLAKKTGNYYSYTHKLVSEMERSKLLNVERKVLNGKESTACRLNSDYKKRWVSDVNTLLKSLFKDAEVKSSIILTIVLAIINIAPNMQYRETGLLQAASQTIEASAEAPASNAQLISTIIIIAVAGLLITWLVRKRLLHYTAK
jgi:hypothetical protein